MGSGQTIIQYGNTPSTAVKLYRCLTRSFEQVPVYDESGTDLMYWKFTVSVTGFLHGHPQTSFYGLVGSPWPTSTHQPLRASTITSAATQHVGMRYMLAPRQSFVMTMGATTGPTSGVSAPSGGTVLLQANPVETTPSLLSGLTNYDVNNGPRCTSFVVTHMVTDEVYRVDATFEICKVECDENGAALGNTRGVLSHRWSVSDSLETNLRTTRTYSGRLRVASANINATSFRHMCVPPLQPGFRRDAMSFRVTESALELDYTITDNEVMAAAPYPARRWSIEHTVQSNNAKMGDSSISVMLEGDRNCNKGDLIEIAIYTISAKMFGKRPEALIPGEPTAILTSLSFTDHIGDVNRITAHATTKSTLDATLGWRAAIRGRNPTPTDPATGNPDALGRPLLATDFYQMQLTLGVYGGSNDPDVAGIANYDPNLSYGARVSDEPEYKGPARLAAIFACRLQSPCNDLHKIVESGQAEGTDANESPEILPRTTITAVSVPELDVDSETLYTDEHVTNPYTFFQMETIYDRNPMRVAMPIAASSSSGGGAIPDGTRVIQLAPHQLRRKVRIHAERVGKEPEFPDAENFPGFIASGDNPTQTLLKSRLMPGTVEYLPDGQKLYRATMEATFAMSKQPAADTPLPVGRDIWTLPESGSDGYVKTSPTLTDGDWGAVTT